MTTAIGNYQDFGSKCLDTLCNTVSNADWRWTYQNWPTPLPNYADGMNIGHSSDDTWIIINNVSFDYNIIFDDGTRKVIFIKNSSYSPFNPQVSNLPPIPNGYIIYDPVIWNTWVPTSNIDMSFLNQYNKQQIQQILDTFVKQRYDTWKASQTSFLHDVIPLAAAFAAIVVSAGAFSATATGATTATDVGTVATESAIPTYIATPVVSSTIPEYIAAATPGAILPVDAALGTDASILGLTGGAAATETGVYGTVENVISSAKDVYAQAKPAISTIAKLDAAYKAATIKPTVKPSQVAQPSGALASSGALIPIGLILGLFLLSA